ncbi:hypothetical protein MA9V2_041 [Chryseobacterium phage MA9V-2]|nr:hypothetical protein MA9V2_041 [Chryseobacterium phage MA9V-2]
MTNLETIKAIIYLALGMLAVLQYVVIVLCKLMYNKSHSGELLNYRTRKEFWLDLIPFYAIYTFSKEYKPFAVIFRFYTDIKANENKTKNIKTHDN